MSHEVTAIESRKAELRLSIGQVQALRALGRELTVSRAWWGKDAELTAKTVVDVVPLGDDSYGVTFRDVVGVVNVGDLHVRVRPKISETHFSYLIKNCMFAPRVATSAASVESDHDYASLLALWCVMEAEAVLTQGLRRDYTEVSDELTEVRGSLNAVATSLAALSGRAVAYCDYEEFNEDSSLNRIVKAACQLVAASPSLESNVRRRARRVALRMDAVGCLQHHDRYTRATRLTAGYGRVLPLARLLLQGGGVTARMGALSGRTFLVRTPELIEDALRRILSRGLPSIGVRKSRLALGRSGFTINPDLVFDDGLAVGDIKYRHLNDEWDRASLYQAVAFATGFGSGHCGVIGFVTERGQKTPQEVLIGNVMARSFAWNASTEVFPSSSEEVLCAEVAEWLAEARAMSSAVCLSNRRGVPNG